jgi:hypothetical protein
MNTDEKLYNLLTAGSLISIVFVLLLLMTRGIIIHTGMYLLFTAGIMYCLVNTVNYLKTSKKWFWSDSGGK